MIRTTASSPARRTSASCTTCTGRPGFLAAYNGGPGRLDDYLTRNRPLPEETRRYVAKIGPRIVDSFPAKRSTAEAYAMNSLPASIPAGPRYAVPAEPVSAAPPVQAMGPVEVAFAPPSSSDGAFDPPPGWTPRGMSPRSAPPTCRRPLRRRPWRPPGARGVGGRRCPSGDFAPAPTPSRRWTRSFRPPVPPAPARTARGEPLPLPPPLPPPVPMVQTASAYAASPQTLQRRDSGLHLIGTANAAPAPVYRGSDGQWAIQVGAFGNEGLAHIAVGAAREQAGAALSGARPAVAGVREPHGTLYRARLTGLSRDAATHACERLRGHGSCIVLSPDAQSCAVAA